MVRCYSCFQENRDDFTVCQHCGRERITKEASPISLPLGTLLQNGRYLIGEQVDEGGFGKVYAAWDTKLSYKVAIKEFYISRIMNRAVGELDVLVSPKNLREYQLYKERFLAEARTMARFQGHPNLTRVYDYFEENKTAYIVMEYLDGSALNKYLAQNNGKVDLELALYIASEVSKALQTLHEDGIIHRDVAPDNIFLCTGEEIRVKLLDLGAARLADSTDDVIDLVAKPGYSPQEQYDQSNKKFGPWMDIYSLGATLYKMITGVQPDESTNRKVQDELQAPNEIDPSIPENLSNTIMKAMAVFKQMRFQRISEFQQALDGQRKVIPLKKERRRRRMRWIGGLTASCILVTVSALACLQIYHEKRAEGILDPAELSVWYSVEEGSGESSAMEAVQADFELAYPEVNLELRGIPQEQYEGEVRAAAQAGTLPDLFESSGLPLDILDQSRDLDRVIGSEQFEKCLFLDQYAQYYAGKKQMPLAIEVPVAYVITNGAVCVAYQDSYFTDLDDFGENTRISSDSRYERLVAANFADEAYADRTEFLEPENNTSPVLLSSTMAMNEIRETLLNYEKTCVYYRADQIRCRFIYEWSIGAEQEADVAAAERLLSWMLGNVYQTTLMISECNDGGIPVNPICFEAKIKARNLKPIAEIYPSFVFEREGESQ